jgi:hypothetical protein
VSKYFSDDPQGFHLKEWTYSELKQLLQALDFSQVSAIWQLRGNQLRLPYLYFQVCEQLLTALPRRLKHVLARLLVPSVCVVAIK